MQHHEKFQSVAAEEPLLFSRELQMGEEKKALPMQLGEAVAQGIIANQTLAYFIGRTFTFLKRVGLNPEVRFHLQIPAVSCSSLQVLMMSQGQTSMMHLALDIHCCNKDVHCCCSCSGCASASTCSMRWRTMLRTAGTRRWTAPTAGSSAWASPIVRPLTYG